MESACKSCVIIQLLAALFLKCNTNLMWNLISLLQVIVYLLIYAIRFPANVQIYLDILRKIAEFKVVEQQDVLEAIGVFNPFLVTNATLEDQEFEKAGFNSTSMLDNLQEYVIVLIAVVIIAFILCATILIVKKLQEKILKRVKKFKNDMIWNGVIRSLKMTYLKTMIASLIVLFKPLNDLVNFIVAAITTSILLSVLFIFPIFLIRNKKDLWRERVRKQYESLYMGLKITQTKALFYPFVFLVKRLIFVVIAIS